MVSLLTFASAATPLRCSLLPRLFRCPMSVVIEYLDGGDGGGPAADTGSAVHFAARAWHTVSGKEVALSVNLMRMAVDKYPLADLNSAEEQFRHYANDPRNTAAQVILCEAKVNIILAPPEGDTEAVVIVGTLDQVRRSEGRLTLWDIKTGAPEGVDMLNTHAMQLAAYQYGASLALAEPVRFAGVIRTKDYLKKDRHRNPKPGPVFYEAPWSYAQLPLLLDMIRRYVGDIRRGDVRISPGDEACRYCVGLANCLRRNRELCTTR